MSNQFVELNIDDNLETKAPEAEAGLGAGQGQDISAAFIKAESNDKSQCKLLGKRKSKAKKQNSESGPGSAKHDEGDDDVLFDEISANQNDNLNEDDRAMRRLIQNRISAKKCRIKKKEQQNRSSQAVNQLQEENDQLKQQLNELTLLMFKKIEENQQTNKKLERSQIQHTVFLTKLLLNVQSLPNSHGVHKMVSDHLAEINVASQKSVQLESPSEAKSTMQSSFNLNQQLISMMNNPTKNEQLQLGQQLSGEFGSQKQPMQSIRSSYPMAGVLTNSPFIQKPARNSPSGFSTMTSSTLASGPGPYFGVSQVGGIGSSGPMPNNILGLLEQMKSSNFNGHQTHNPLQLAHMLSAQSKSPIA